MSKWLAPVAFLKWLAAGERLTCAKLPNTTVSEPARVGFWRWLLSSENLPAGDATPSEPVPVGLLRFIFSAEELPKSLSVETPSTNSGTSKMPGSET